MNNLLLFLNMGGGEIFIVVLAIYLLFGPKKIPEFARMLGKGLNELRRATDDIRNEIKREANKIKDDIDVNIKDPFQPNVKTASKNEPKPANEGEKKEDTPQSRKDPPASEVTNPG